MIIDIPIIISTFVCFFVGLYFLFIFGLKTTSEYSSFDGVKQELSIKRIIILFLWSGFMICSFLESFGAIDTIPNGYGNKINASIIVSLTFFIAALLVGIKAKKNETSRNNQ